MPCNHKFQSELDLGSIDYPPVTLIVGTFIPPLPVGEPVEWFYGKLSNNHFWNVLPRLYGEASLMTAIPNEWKQFCRDKQIAFTDLISSIDDADPSSPADIKILAGFSDKAVEYNYEDFTFINIVQILQRNPSIKNVYITRGITDAFWRHLWNPVMQYCNRNGLHERRLVSPSDTSVHQHGAYNDQNPENQISLLEDYILMRWRQEWHC